MVIKTEVCSFTEFRIYPGHGEFAGVALSLAFRRRCCGMRSSRSKLTSPSGIKMVRKDGLVVTFINHKSRRLYNQNVKPVKLTWTTAWRRLHKKDVKTDALRQRKRRVVRVARSFVGLSVDDIQKKKKELPQLRAAQDAATKELQERKAKHAAEAKKTGGGGDKPKVPQQQQAQKSKAHVSKAR